MNLLWCHIRCLQGSELPPCKAHIADHERQGVSDLLLAAMHLDHAFCLRALGAVTSLNLDVGPSPLHDLSHSLAASADDLASLLAVDPELEALLLVRPGFWSADSDACTIIFEDSAIWLLGEGHLGEDELPSFGLRLGIAAEREPSLIAVNVDATTGLVLEPSDVLPSAAEHPTNLDAVDHQGIANLGTSIRTAVFQHLSSVVPDIASNFHHQFDRNPARLRTALDLNISFLLAGIHIFLALNPQTRL